MGVNFTAADRVGGIGGYIGGIATLLGLAGNGLWGMNPAMANANGGCSENTPVTRYELSMALDSAAKDSKIALLESEKYSDQKLVDVYTQLDTKIQANKAAQDAVNTQQAVLGATTTATINCIQQNLAALTGQFNGLTKIVIPNSSVCPGWGNVTITPTTSGTTVS